MSSFESLYRHSHFRRIKQALPGKFTMRVLEDCLKILEASDIPQANRLLWVSGVGMVQERYTTEKELYRAEEEIVNKLEKLIP